MEVNSDDSGFEEQTEVQSKATFDFTTEVKRPSKIQEVLPALTVQPLTGYGSSLLPDMHFGWRPKVVHGGPIPLLFNKAELPVLRNAITGEEFEVIFHGFRPKDTFVLHTEFAGPDTYPVPSYPTMQVYELLHKSSSQVIDPRPFLGMSPRLSASDLHFDSTFESGNLDKVVRVREYEYDLYMRTDANTRGHHQWFYFSAVSPKSCEVRFHILNFTKSNSLYSQGMRPYVYCESEECWRPAGEKIIYRASKINPFVRRCYYSLTFSYFFRKAGEKVYFAYSIPYTYTQLCTFLRELTQAAGEMRIKRELLCRSLSGVDTPFLTVTDFAVPLRRKRSVVVTGRVHPGETFGSYMMEGFLKFLVSDDPEATALRRKVVIHVVPMLNPDGVIMGNYRTGFAGCDLNRQFRNPDFVLHPTVMAVKSLITRVWKESELLAFLDLHAHSKQKCVFLYGPHFPLHSDKYEKTRVLPKLICAKSPLFRLSSCKFRNERSKRKAARLVIYKEFKIATSYTIEASFYGFITPSRTTQQFTEVLVQEAGAAIAQGLCDYALIEERNSLLLEEKRKKRKARRTKTAADSLTTVQVNPPTNPVVVESETVDAPVLEGTLEREANSSSSSDGDGSEDDLEEADAQFLHHEIAVAMQDFSDLSGSSKRPPRPQRLRDRATPQPQDYDAKSSLEHYFSKADDMDRKRGSCRPSGKPLIPKVYNPLIPIRQKRALRSISQRPIELLLRQNTTEDITRNQHHSSAEPGRTTPSTMASDLAHRLGIWMRRRPPQTARKMSRDSEDDCTDAVNSRLISPAPRQIKAFRGDSVADRHSRKVYVKGFLTKDFPAKLET